MFVTSDLDSYAARVSLITRVKVCYINVNINCHFLVYQDTIG